MAVLGVGGILRLRRDPPVPVRIQASELDTGSNSIATSDPNIWSGDDVVFAAERGLPINITKGAVTTAPDLAIPDCPDGYGMYAGSKWIKSNTKGHVTGNASKYYAANNDNYFYMRPADSGYTPSKRYFVYRDQLDRLSFYSTRAAALRGKPADRIALLNVDFGEATLTYQQPEAWSVQADVLEWRLNLQAAEVDTASLGDRFGDSVKSLITGGGALDFFVDRKDLANTSDSTFLLNLLMMTEKGCQAEAEFWLVPSRAEKNNYLLPGDLFYEANIMVTGLALNTRPDAIIAGSIDFVTVRTISIRMGTA